MREYFEKIEDETLAPYALKSKDSIGRTYDEKPDLYRTCFQRDRDRILHSKAFRRLKQKTQVVGVFSGDHYRTRLTHSLEVSQISRQIARMLRLNEDVVESIALAHDLGHTPFGHVGERELNQLMVDEGGFEHNEQSRRIVDLLESRYPDFPGLNLSYEILDGLIKHKTPYDNAPSRGDSHDFVFSLEAQIVNLADEIAYNNHDLDDGISSGILNMEDLAKHIDLWKMAISEIKKKYTSVTLNELHRLSISFLIGYQVVDAYEQALINIEEKDINSFTDIKNQTLVGFSKEMSQKNKQLRAYLKNEFYNHPRIEVMNNKGAFIVRELFSMYMAHPELLPRGNNKFLKDIPHRRQITDYIASMTDNFAETTYYSLGETHEIRKTG